MSRHAAAGASVNTVTAGPRSKGRAPKSAMAGKRKMVALTAAVVFVGGVTACSSPTSTSAPEPQASASEATAIPADVISTPEPQTSASEATGIPADVISAYMEAWCFGMGTYDEATVTCSNDGGALTWEDLNALLWSQGQGSASELWHQYTELGVSEDDYRDCPSEADLRARLATVEVDPPAISDECLTTVLIQKTKELKESALEFGTWSKP